jgi:calcium permeable stress-gated cation channel
MDALCFLRVLSFGYRIALLGCFNAIWLMPLYNSAEPSSETRSIVDGIVQVTISNVPSQSKRLIGTALAAWSVFGYTMYLLYREFEWYVVISFLLT